jgi:hypothetical protein
MGHPVSLLSRVERGMCGSLIFDDLKLCDAVDGWIKLFDGVSCSCPMMSVGVTCESVMDRALTGHSFRMRLCCKLFADQ